MYKVSVYWKENLISEINVDDKKVTFRNYNIVAEVFLPFGRRKFATYNDLMEFYESRCFPKERVNCAEILKHLGLDTYEPELICRKTHGIQNDDYIWLQFSDEKQVKYNDIKFRD